MNKCWKFVSELAKKTLGHQMHARLYQLYHYYTTFGFKRIRRFRKIPIYSNPYKLAACAIMKNEGPYLREWIEFHKLVGFDKFYLYANDCTDDTESILQPYINSGLVEMIVFNGERMQFAAYEDCLERCCCKTEWIAFFDLDEFIVPVEFKSLLPILDSLSSNCSQVLLKWLSFGSNGNEKMTDGLVIERFTRRGGEGCCLGQTKSIARPRRVYHTHVHSQFVIGDTITLGIDTARVNHYHCKSWEEYSKRGNRGGADRTKAEAIRKYTREFFDLHDNNQEEDLVAYRFVSEIKQILSTK